MAADGWAMARHLSVGPGCRVSNALANAQEVTRVTRRVSAERHEQCSDQRDDSRAAYAIAD